MAITKTFVNFMSIKITGSNLFNLTRFAAFGVGIALGIVQVGEFNNKRLKVYKDAVKERDDRIRELLTEKMLRENPPTSSEVKSSGDPVQDW
eukprot:CAMPEP_0184691998 /NCGR_PEP_ID=MMETSP0313-20130426/658_1 /TAXON_ID=2792 /ORGANISM="Porphyridium aerugineum, Strain SAG 1380-2" /LENGTH=91 /DNA_ID=CAMNT_0027149791 /DNA_START=160 /DNA_END=432 /DNA_ORIENTATION=+